MAPPLFVRPVCPRDRSIDQARILEVGARSLFGLARAVAFVFSEAALVDARQADKAPHVATEGDGARCPPMGFPAPGPRQEIWRCSGGLHHPPAILAGLARRPRAS